MDTTVEPGAAITYPMGEPDWPPEVPTFLIASAENAQRWLSGHFKDSFRHVVSILNPRSAYQVNVEPPDALAVHPARRLVITFDDWPYPSGVEPTTSDVQRILDFLDGVGMDGGLLIHCNGGVSRSGAVGYLFAAMRMGLGKEPQALDLAQLAAKRNGRQISPNHLIVDYAAYLLKRRALKVPIY